MKSGDGFIMVFDRSRPDTFDSIREWYSHIRQSCQDGIPVILVGNKSDID